MVRHDNNTITYAPLYIHSFQLLQPHFSADAEKFNRADTDLCTLATPDKLRYYRYKKGLLQRDVADAAGIDRTTYAYYEEGVRDITDMCLLDQIAKVLGIESIDILDDGYISFLYHGQADQIREHREGMGMTWIEFAAHFDLEYSTVRNWERGATRMTRKMWERVFKQ